MGRNPQTGEAIRIKASRRVRVTPLKAFKDAVLTGKRPAKKAAGQEGGSGEEGRARQEGRREEGAGQEGRTRQEGRGEEDGRPQGAGQEGSGEEDRGEEDHPPLATLAPHPAVHEHRDTR